MILAVLHFVAVNVQLAGFGPPAFKVLVQLHADDRVRGQKTVINALFETVGIDGLAEVVAIGDVFRFLGRGGHADVRGGMEIVQDLAPAGIFTRTAPVAFIHDDQVKKGGGEGAEGLFVLVPGQLLVQRQVYFVRAVQLFVLDLVHLVAEGGKVLAHGLVHKDVAVGKEEDALFAAGLPQTVDDLEGRIGLARPGGHDQQDALLPARHGLHRAVDGDALVVAGRVDVVRKVVRLLDELFFFRRIGACLTESLPEIFR